MLAEWIILGGVLFWVLLGVLSIVLLALLHSDDDAECWVAGMVLFAVFTAVLATIGNVRPWFAAHPWSWVWLPSGYLAVGAVWCLPRWMILLANVRAWYIAETRVFGRLDESTWKRWSEVVSSMFYAYGMSFDAKTGKLIPPRAVANKTRIAAWCVLWPWSIVDAVFHNVFRWIKESLVRLYRRLFDWLSEWWFSDL